MPHMMPMMWTLIMLFSLMILLTIISMTYFIYTPLFNKFNLIYNSHSSKNKWNWKW
uniref:ATP synthase F0 subunit 8 n=1 Tax=Lasius niger TaxID=67767 RepID=A0A7L7S8H5_LASNI|nr:ATP synthase F0 subunit 8 [Lasius niger]